MGAVTPNDVNAGLERQALRRPLSEDEQRLAAAMEQIFRTGEHDFEKVVQHLQQQGIKAPSGASGAWTTGMLERELAAINASLDRAYLAAGGG